MTTAGLWCAGRSPASSSRLNVIARKSRVADSGVTPLDGHLDRDVARKKSWGFWGFLLILGIFLCILGFYNRNGFIWRGLNPLNMPMYMVLHRRIDRPILHY